MEGETKTVVNAQPILQEDLKLFYKNLFPFKELYQWLSYAKGDDDTGEFTKREFSFVLMTPTGEEIYVRNQSYTSQQQFQTDLTKACPHKIDIGGIYTVPPKQHAAYSSEAMRVKEREFVFDIDMDDYSEVRRCCENGKAKTLCTRCWPFLHVAIQVIRKACRELFGFEKCLFVFSGRRGIHCWIADKRARLLTSKARQAILDFLIIPVQASMANVSKQPLYNELHPFFSEIYDDILLPSFEGSILDKQGLLEDEEGQDLVLQFIPDSATKAALKEVWDKEGKTSSAHHKWLQFKETVKKEMQSDLEKSRKNRSHKRQFFSDPVLDVVFAFTYPRFDKNVSIGLNHLLKSPFCIHPGTGKVCVPIDPSKSAEFDPENVPTLDLMIEELAQGKPSSMKPCIQLFNKKFLAPIQRETCATNSDPTDF